EVRHDLRKRAVVRGMPAEGLDKRIGKFAEGRVRLRREVEHRGRASAAHELAEPCELETEGGTSAPDLRDGEHSTVPEDAVVDERIEQRDVRRHAVCAVLRVRAAPPPGARAGLENGDHDRSRCHARSVADRGSDSQRLDGTMASYQGAW